MRLAAKDFANSLAADRPPAGLDAPLEALWWDAKGEWDRAHACVDDKSDQESVRVHAYLHRKEGDLSNAGYWYGRVGMTAPDTTLAAEHQALLDDLVASGA
jgi:hypothetical protein